MVRNLKSFHRKTHKIFQNNKTIGYNSFNISSFCSSKIKNYSNCLKRKLFRKIPAKFSRNNSIISTCPNSVNNSISKLEIKGSENKVPEYYLPKIINSTKNINNDTILHDRHLAHFKFLRKCFKIIHKFKNVKTFVKFSSDKHERKILVLDLDETLVHTYEKNPPLNSQAIKINLYNKDEKTIHVKLRPFCLDFLTEACKFFDIYIFTASHKTYADPVINLIDPKKTIFKGRLYIDSCTNINGVIVKDLRIFNKDLRDIILVDNTALCWGLQKENGIPIVCYRGQDDDEELRLLMPFLEYLNSYSDVRKGIMNYFRWDQLLALYDNEKALLEHYLY